MLTALNSKKNKVVSFETSQKEAPFFCPECEEKLILKQGNKKIHHFSHTANNSCFCAGESIRHLEIKKEIYNGLKKCSNVRCVELEQKIGNRRTDIYYNDGQHRVIEIQNSSIAEYEILQRMIDYSSFNCSVLWIMAKPIEKILNTQYLTYPDLYSVHSPDIEVRLKNWELYIKNLYYGFLYYHYKGALVVPVRYQDVERYVEEFYRDGKVYGDYYKKLKTIKQPDIYIPHHIVNEFDFSKCIQLATKNTIYIHDLKLLDDMDYYPDMVGEFMSDPKYYDFFKYFKDDDYLYYSYINANIEEEEINKYMNKTELKEVA